jgi:hypothetical protein
VGAAQVSDEHPADRHQAVARLEPVARAGDRPDPPGAPAVPGDRQPLVPSGGGDGLAGLGPPWPLTGGRPLPLEGGGGSDRLASGWSLLTRLSRSRCRWQTRATSWVP